MNNLFLGDCLDILPTLNSHSFDVGITSPPYNLGGDFHSSSKADSKRRSYGGYKEFSDNLPEDVYQEKQIIVLNELHRIIKPDGWLFYNHKNRIKQGEIISPLEWIKKTDWIVYQDIVIDMRGTTNNDKRRFFTAHEFIFILSASKGNKLYNKDCLTSVWSFPQVNRDSVNHPASFHVGLPTACLKSIPLFSASVIDPYMGIGTTGKACLDLDFSFTGIEINKDYFEIAKKYFEKQRPKQISF